MDALSRSNLPFLEQMGFQMDPTLKAHLERNWHMFMLGKLERVPMKSMQLFICGDTYTGKTTLLSTLHSIHLGPRKRDKLHATMTRDVKDNLFTSI